MPGPAQAILFRLPPTEAASARARQIIETHAAGLERELRFRAQLLASELVANSIRHANLNPDDRVELRLQLGPDWVWVEVCDTGPGFEPEQSLPDENAVSGRGISLLDALAERWGTLRRGRHFGIWFRVTSTAPTDPIDAADVGTQATART